MLFSRIAEELLRILSFLNTRFILALMKLEKLKLTLVKLVFRELFVRDS